MKFKVGDKVILGKPDFDLVDSMHCQFGKEDTIISCEDTAHGLYYRMNMSSWRWHESGLALAEPQEYFYVGQTVYSPFFQNKERKGVIKEILNGESLPIRISLDVFSYSFTLDGRLKEEHDFISLFQEPIQFPVNKPIERFEQGEIVEVSDCGSLWMISYYRCKSGNENYPYRCSSLKRDGDVTDGVNYKKIRKIK